MSLSKQKTLAGQESRSITVTRAKVFTAISVLRLWQLKATAHSTRTELAGSDATVKCKVSGEAVAL